MKTLFKLIGLSLLVASQAKAAGPIRYGSAHYIVTREHMSMKDGMAMQSSEDLCDITAKVAVYDAVHAPVNFVNDTVICFVPAHGGEPEHQIEISAFIILAPSSSRDFAGNVKQFGLYGNVRDKNPDGSTTPSVTLPPVTPQNAIVQDLNLKSMQLYADPVQSEVCKDGHCVITNPDVISVRATLTDSI